MVLTATWCQVPTTSAGPAMELPYCVKNSVRLASAPSQYPCCGALKAPYPEKKYSTPAALGASMRIHCSMVRAARPVEKPVVFPRAYAVGLVK